MIIMVWVLRALFCLAAILTLVVLCRMVLFAFRAGKSKRSSLSEDLDSLLIIELTDDEEEVRSAISAEAAITASIKSLLAAGNALLSKLSASTRKHLSEPVSDEMRGRLSVGDDLDQSIAPEQIRATLAIAEASLAIESIMSGSKRGGESRIAHLNARRKQIIVNNTAFSFRYFYDRIRKEANVSAASAEDLWCGIISLLCEDVRIPGLRVKRSVAAVRLL